MLRSLKDLLGYTLSAQDGEIGRVHDLYFVDDSWTVRYLVVKTSHWLAGRKVLLTPNVVEKPGWSSRRLGTSLTKEQVKMSPDIETDLPVSRQKEIELHHHYGWPVYWVPAGAGPWIVLAPTPQPRGQSPGETPSEPAEPHLRSVNEVTGYHLHAKDGSIGHVADFIGDDASWKIRYLVVDTRKWLPGRQVLIPSDWLVQDIDWASRTVEVALTRETIRNSPEYDAGSPLSREVEGRLFDYYQRPPYWVTEKVEPDPHREPGQKVKPEARTGQGQ